MSQLTDMLVRHEGLKLKPYVDTVGKLTIGVGRNLIDRGITKEEAYALLANDVAETYADLSHAFGWFGTLTPARQDAMIDLTFNLGYQKLLTFVHFLAMMHAGDWATAADELLNSKWARQVGARATELASMIRTGVYA